MLPSCLLKRLNRLRVAVKRVFALARVRALRCVFECVCVFAWYRHTLNLIWTIWGENEQPSMVMIRYGNVAFGVHCQMQWAITVESQEWLDSARSACAAHEILPMWMT